MSKPFNDQFQFSWLPQAPTKTASEQSIVPHKGPNPKSKIQSNYTTQFGDLEKTSLILFPSLYVDYSLKKKIILYESVVVLRERER